jgi:hypothetical protein
MRGESLKLQFSAKAGTLTEGFFLYRLIVFCPEQSKSSTANESYEEQQPAEGSEELGR